MAFRRRQEERNWGLQDASVQHVTMATTRWLLTRRYLQKMQTLWFKSRFRS